MTHFKVQCRLSLVETEKNHENSGHDGRDYKRLPPEYKW
jgi:hypothetical protein